jgi:hypothetical protein
MLNRACAYLLLSDLFLPFSVFLMLYKLPIFSNTPNFDNDWMSIQLLFSYMLILRFVKYFL